MGKFATYSVAVALIASLAGTASAATIKLTSSGLGPSVQVDMWFEDSTRTADLLALQFDIDLPATGVGSLAAVPGFKGPNVQRTDGVVDPVVTPFDLSNTVNDPTGLIDVRVVHAATAVFDINGLAAQAAALPTCSGAACALANAGLGLNRVYLGSFNMNYDGLTPVYYTLPANSIFGEGDEQPQNGTDPIIIELRTGSGPNNRAIQGLAPEPASLTLLGLALGALSFARRRS
jgi:hypothetical protein